MFKKQFKFLTIALFVALIATSIPQSVDAAEKVAFSDVKKGHGTKQRWSGQFQKT